MADSEKNIIVDDQDRTEWDRVWSSMELRKVEDATKVDVQALFRHDFGPSISVLVSKIPEQYIAKMYFPTKDCPLCSNPANDPETTFAASLTLEFERIKRLGVSVWVHRECFDKLPISDKPTPVPW